MKKALIISVSLNVMIITVLVCKRYYYSHQSKQITRNVFFDQWDTMRTDLLRSLPIDSNDVVFVGNSLSEGFPVTEIYGAHFKSRGIGGNNTNHILNRITGIADNHPRKIFLEAGLNDLIASYPVDSIFNNYKRIIQIINNRSPKTGVYVQSTTPARGSYSYLNDSIRRLNDKLSRYCIENSIQFVDLYTQMATNNCLNNNLTSDGIHLNGKGYEIWRKVIGQFLK